MAFDAFLKIEGIDGEGTAAKRHEKWIELSSWSFGETRQDAGAVGTTLTFQDFTFTHKIDKASPLLLSSIAQGQRLDLGNPVVLEVERPIPNRTPYIYMKVELENVFITSLAPHQGGTGEVPLESVSLNFAKVDFTYTPLEKGTPGQAVQGEAQLT